MMRLNVYSVFDAKAKAFITPFFMPNDAVAERAFRQAVNDPTHEFSKAAEDYTLFCIGEWSMESGEVVGFAPRSVKLAALLREVA